MWEINPTSLHCSFTKAQNWFKQWLEEDEFIVYRALEDTQLTEFSDRLVHSLSGGRRQRAWIAMTLAQRTDTFLLDEPWQAGRHRNM